MKRAVCEKTRHAKKDARILMRLISQSEQDFRSGRWKSQKAVEAELQRTLKNVGW
jgi:hypothetical protein